MGLRLAVSGQPILPQAIPTPCISGAQAAEFLALSMLSQQPRLRPLLLQLSTVIRTTAVAFRPSRYPLALFFLTRRPSCDAATPSPSSSSPAAPPTAPASVASLAPVFKYVLARIQQHSYAPCAIKTRPLNEKYIYNVIQRRFPRDCVNTIWLLITDRQFLVPGSWLLDLSCGPLIDASPLHVLLFLCLHPCST